jgi:hypothetical protein
MNWDAAGVIVEFAGLVIVVLSLFYLAKQIRQNSSLMELQQIQSTTANRLAVYALQSEPQMANLIGRTYISGETDVDLSPSDIPMMEGYIFSYMEIVQSRFAGYEKGFLDEDEWERDAFLIGPLLSAPWGRQWWEEFKHSFYSPAFVTAVDQVLSNEEGASYTDRVQKVGKERN